MQDLDEDCEARRAARKLVMGLQKRTDEAEEKAAKAYEENERLVRLILEIQSKAGPETMAAVEENRTLAAKLAEEQKRKQRLAETCAQKIANATELLEQRERERDHWKLAAEEAVDEIAQRQRVIDSLKIRLTQALATQRRQMQQRGVPSPPPVPPGP